MIMIDKIAEGGKKKGLMTVLEKIKGAAGEFGKTTAGEALPAAAITAAGTGAGAYLGYRKGRQRERMEQKKKK